MRAGNDQRKPTCEVANRKRGLKQSYSREGLRSFVFEMTLGRGFLDRHCFSPVQLTQPSKSSSKNLMVKASSGSVYLDAPTAADYGRILGIGPNATKSEVKAAYRKLALHCHPDVSKSGESCEAKFIEVHRAYESLIAVAPSGNQSQRNYTYSTCSSKISVYNTCEAESVLGGAVKGDDPRVACLQSLIDGTHVEIPEDYSRYYSNLRQYFKASRKTGYNYFQGNW